MVNFESGKWWVGEDVVNFVCGHVGDRKGWGRCGQLCLWSCWGQKGVGEMSSTLSVVMLGTERGGGDVVNFVCGHVGDRKGWGQKGAGEMSSTSKVPLRRSKVPLRRWGGGGGGGVVVNFENGICLGVGGETNVSFVGVLSVDQVIDCGLRVLSTVCFSWCALFVGYRRHVGLVQMAVCA